MRVLENGYIVRDVGLDQINGLARLHRSSFQQSWSADDFALFLQDRSMRMFVAFQQGVKGPLAFLLVRSAADEAEVISLAVEPKHRRRGLGEGLMDLAIDALLEQGITTLHLEVDEQNVAAVKLYENLGFDVVGTRKAYYRQGQGEKATSALVMSLQLGEDD